MTGERAAEHYRRVHPVTGEVVQVRPEFLTMSRAGGIGYEYYRRFASDMFPSDEVVHDGKRHPVPRFYTERLEEETREKTKLKRIGKARKRAAHNTPARLQVREELAHARQARIKRGG